MCRPCNDEASGHVLDGQASAEPAGDGQQMLHPGAADD